MCVTNTVSTRAGTVELIYFTDSLSTVVIYVTWILLSFDCCLHCSPPLYINPTVCQLFLATAHQSSSMSTIVCYSTSSHWQCVNCCNILYMNFVVCQLLPSIVDVELFRTVACCHATVCLLLSTIVQWIWQSVNCWAMDSVCVIYDWWGASPQLIIMRHWTCVSSSTSGMHFYVVHVIHI